MVSKCLTTHSSIQVYECCSDLALCINYGHLFLHLDTAIFPVSGVKTDQPRNLPPEIYNELHVDFSLHPLVYMKAYFWHTELFKKKSDGSQVSSLFLDNNRQHIMVCGNTISSRVRNILSFAKIHMSVGSCGFDSWCLPGIYPIAW